MRECYCVMYNGENLYQYQMTNDEMKLVEELRKECMDICDRLNIPRGKCADGTPYMGRLKDDYDFALKYKTGIGYFVLVGERGIFSMQAGFPEQNREKAKFYLLKEEFSYGCHEYELEHREELQEAWEGKYQVEYDSRKAAFEYEIQKHIEVGSCLTEEVIAQCTNYMNMWFEKQHWYFNNESMLFEEIDE